MNRVTVLILSSDPAFARMITANWPQDNSAKSSSEKSSENNAAKSGTPQFIVLAPGLSRDFDHAPYDLAIADAGADESLPGKPQSQKQAEPTAGKKTQQNVQNDFRSEDQNRDQAQAHEIKRALAATGKPAIVIHSDSALEGYTTEGAVIGLPRETLIWPAIAGLIGREILRRSQAESRRREAEKLSALAQGDATLGRYMLEMRTNVNNALTTMLGNAELLTHESGLPARVQVQADAIRNMALRLHEIFQRFSSLEKELAINARDPGKRDSAEHDSIKHDSAKKFSRAAAAGRT